MSDPHSYRTNFRELAHAHGQWSEATFGTSEMRGPLGPLRHLQKEVQEAIDAPYDASEYADLLLLVLDASRRAGLSGLGLVAQAFAKLDANKLRDWPVGEPDQPVEHVRGTSDTDPFPALRAMAESVKLGHTTDREVRAKLTEGPQEPYTPGPRQAVAEPAPIDLRFVRGPRAASKVLGSEMRDLPPRGDYE